MAIKTLEGKVTGVRLVAFNSKEQVRRGAIATHSAIGSVNVEELTTCDYSMTIQSPAGEKTVSFNAPVKNYGDRIGGELSAEDLVGQEIKYEVKIGRDEGITEGSLAEERLKVLSGPLAGKEYSFSYMTPHRSPSEI